MRSVYQWVKRLWYGIGLSVALVTLGGCVTTGRDMRSEDRTIPVTVRVDFGPAGKPAQEAQLQVNPGSTPKDVVSLIYPVQSGAACCDSREVAAIDGVRVDPAQNRWWKCRLNGSTKVGPFRTVLKSGDRVEWTYFEQSQ